MNNTSTGLFSNMRLRAKVGLSFGLMLLVLLSAVAITIYEVDDVQFLSNRVAELRTPTAEASLSMINGVNMSLAGLRGWMLLGNPQFKDVRADAWNTWIDKPVADMDELSKSWTNPENVKRLKELKVDIEKFRKFQQEIEDIAQTDDENPALKILFNEAAPRGTKMATLITQLIDLEAKLEGSDLRKSILYMMADIRGTTGLGLAAIRAYLISGEDQFRERFNTLWTKNEKRFNDLSNAYQHLTPEQQSAFNQFKSVRDEFKVLPPKMFEIRGKEDWNVANYWLATRAAPIAAGIVATLTDMVEDQKELLRKDTDGVAELVTELDTLQLILGAVGIMITIGLLMMVNRVIINPIIRVADTVRTIASERDLTHTVPVESRDEIGMMSGALNDMIKVIHSAFDVVSDAAKEVDRGSNDVAGRASANRSRAQQQYERAQQSSQVIGEMGTTAGNVRSATEAQQNAAIESQGRVAELLEKMKKVADTTVASDNEVQQTLNRVGEMGQTGAKVVASAQSQEQLVGRVTNSIEDMVSSVSEMQNAVNQATEFGKSSLDAAEEGHTSVSATVEGMRSISESSEQISEIIDVITEIAEQTNLLALNAAVEAARAGAHGKGFAVVADEVGKLAQRSSEAAKEITQLIKDSSSGVAEGVRLSDMSQQALQKIDQSGRVNMEAIDAISNSAQGLNDATQQVQTLIEELNVVAREIGGMAGEQGERRAAAQQALDLVVDYSKSITELVGEASDNVQDINTQMEGVVERSNEMNKMTGEQATRSQKVSAISAESAEAAEATVEGAGVVVSVTEDLQKQSQNLTEQVQQFKI
ncbi:MAG: methyl-accepting chemotaxis protein [Pseudomonadota bacterium]